MVACLTVACGEAEIPVGNDAGRRFTWTANCRLAGSAVSCWLEDTSGYDRTASATWHADGPATMPVPGRFEPNGPGELAISAGYPDLAGAFQTRIVARYLLTNRFGSYELDPVLPGEDFTVRAEKEGYEPVTTSYRVSISTFEMIGHDSLALRLRPLPR